jgi:hypothetical protein
MIWKMNQVAARKHCKLGATLDDPRALRSDLKKLNRLAESEDEKGLPAPEEFGYSQSISIPVYQRSSGS